jgi:hypothetical protein
MYVGSQATPVPLNGGATPIQHGLEFARASDEKHTYTEL